MNSLRQLPSILIFIALMTAFFSSSAPTEATENAAPPTFIQLAGQTVVEDSFVAVGEIGTLPAELDGGTIVETNRFTLAGGQQEVVMYAASSTGDTQADYDNVINTIEGTISDSCADLNPLYSSGGSWGSGSRYEINMANGRNQSETFFESQWAFNQIDWQERTDSTAGSGTRVVVMDVFADAFTERWVNEMTVSFHEPVLIIEPEYSSNAIDGMDMHGDLTLSLAREVAPASEFWAVNTFNKEGASYSYLIIEALNYVLTNYDPAVDGRLIVNMSFGGDQEVDNCGIIESMIETAATEQGVVFIASAGNETIDLAAQQSAQFPANLSTVIGVSASNHQADYSSFANAGDIMAPGGDQPYFGANHCNDVVKNVVGRIPMIERGRVRWVNVHSCGSSFSAPLVTGAAARLLGEESLTAAETMTRVVDSASQNNGILSINDLFSDVTSGLDPYSPDDGTVEVLLGTR